MYQLPKVLEGWVVQSVMRLTDNASIPFDPANTDYQQFLAWLEEGNTVLPADENNDG